MRKRLLIFIVGSMLFAPESAFSADQSVIIGFKQKPGPSERALIHGARGIIKRNYELIPAMVAEIPEQEIAKLRKSDRIAYVEENAVYRAAADPLPSQEYENSWGVQHIRAEVSHASGNRGAGVRVAVLDTGIDYDHEELDGNYVAGRDFVFDDDDPFDDSYNSHGTHVAGIIAAEENGIGVVGVAPEVDLFAVKVLDGAGFGLADWIIAGIEWAVLNGVEVINMSIEGPDVQGLHDACDAAYAAGVILVAAGGNSLAGQGPVEFPAAYDSVIAVTATDPSDLPGRFAPVGEEVELAAPGVDVLSTVAGGGYDFLSGTSQAAPHVAGVAALSILSNTKDINGDGMVDHEDVRLMLQTSAIDLGDAGRDEIYGFGLVDGAAAAFTPGIALSATRTTGSPKRDAQLTEVADALYEISIKNSDLQMVTVDVFEDDVL
ncbi:MAG: S8 family serine peptidase, partial [Deltaproteobacteria bacterium]|nr:S8 family serine peptidase [Deltaproteobacteria bacterium]